MDNIYSHGEYQNVKLRKRKKYKLIDIVCCIVEFSLEGILCKKETGRNIDMGKNVYKCNQAWDILYQVMYVYLALSNKDTEYRTYSIKYERIIILTVLLH